MPADAKRPGKKYLEYHQREVFKGYWSGPTSSGSR